jgi:TetR/AcrR family transcriptional regulator, fatty acid metabolism regulator protein
MTPSTRASGDTSERIIAAALDCFIQHGYNNTTMDQIAAASGTSKGTLYWHFRSKDALFASAIQTFFEETLGEEALASLAAYPTAAAQLHALTERMMAVIEECEGLFNLFLEFWASSDNRVEASRIWVDMLIAAKEVVTGIIDQGIAAGEFRAVDAEHLVWAVMAAYDGLAAYSVLKPDLDPRQAHTAFIEVILRGLEADP